jgi:hypothetical protein
MKARVVFYLHALVAAYCITCGLLDLHGHPVRWLIPNNPVFCFLLGSAVVFPVWGILTAARTRPKHPIALVAAHFAVAAGQVFLGLLPLIS